ncbi:uncharacterized protein LOC105841041 isoform X3 [Monomorium pharaonis]|uniref:uncharacterized protein LOC105841041 isoform X3 n=1 Tax=Monomorium pharaonis TaxID=307658 RepID=UPI0017468D7C|nr:uncharacterized protein LOC105841041 isoform X3 [Monomorium pharaonis]
MKRRHIDDVQMSTVDEHFNLLLKDNNLIEQNFTRVTHEDLPSWYDEELFKEGQNYYKRNMMQMVLSSFVGLLAIIAFPETLKILKYTGKSSLPCVTFSRYTQTLLHIYKLYTSDPNDPKSELNLCRKTAAETHKLCLKINDILTDCLNNAPCEFYHMALAILDGLWYIDMTLDKHAFLKFTYQLHGLEYNKPLGWYSRLNAKYRDFVLYLCLIPYVGAIVKTYYKYVLLFTLWLVQKWPILAWLSFGKNNSRITLY